jgi:hypothetical protein
MPTTTDVQAWIGQQLVGPDQDKIGKIDQVYLDRQSGEPTFRRGQDRLVRLQCLARADR